MNNNSYGLCSFGSNNWWWIIILILVLCYSGGNGCGCDDRCGCC